MNIADVKTDICQIIANVDIAQRHGFIIWMKNYIDDILEDMSQSNADVMMGAIQEDIRQEMPADAVYSSEQIVTPVIGPNADCHKGITAHVDGFLYDEETIDQLCEEGRMSRHYCTQCGCRQVSPLKFISHSSSLTQLKFMFEHMLPDLNGKTVLDVGSRTGAVLYAAYHYSEAAKVIGVELNPDLCNLQQGIVDKYHLNDRITVIQSDICNQTEILKTADVIIMNNVFEFFAPADIQHRIWQHLSQWIRRPGVLLVTTPTLECALQPFQTGIDMTTWVQKIDTREAMKQANLILWRNKTADESDLEDIHLYRVL